MQVITDWFKQEILKKAQDLMPYVGLLDDVGDEITGGDPEYTRLAATWDNPWDNPSPSYIMTLAADLTFNVPGGGTVVSGWRAFSAVTGGEAGPGQLFDTPVTYQGQGTYLLEAHQAALEAKGVI